MIPALEAIIEAGCACHGLTRHQLFGRSSSPDYCSRRYVRARDQTVYIARKLTGASLMELAAEFGRCHHTSILLGLRRAQERCRSDPAYAKEVAEIELVIKYGRLEVLRAEVARLEAAVNGGGA